MGDKYQSSTRPNSLIDTIESYNGCSENEIIWDDKDSPWYLTADTPFIISNKVGFLRFSSYNDVGDKLIYHQLGTYIHSYQYQSCYAGTS